MLAFWNQWNGRVELQEETTRKYKKANNGIRLQMDQVHSMRQEYFQIMLSGYTSSLDVCSCTEAKN